MLTQGYFEFYLIIFFILHLVITAAVALRRSRAELRNLARRAASLAQWGGIVAILLAGPFVVASFLSLQAGQVDPQSNSDRASSNSADLARFFVPPPTHWLFGGQSPSVADRASTYLGFTALFLAVFALWRARVRGLWFWAVVALVGMLLALGPTLDVNGTDIFGVGIPMPFAFLQHISLFRLISAPERFAYLTYLGLGVLAGYGLTTLLSRLPSVRRPVLALVLAALVLLELPIHPRLIMPLTTPLSMDILAKDPQPGAVFELPLIAQGWKLARRMLAQTFHGRPITSAYLSRPIADPFGQACSPFKVFTEYPNITASDIVSPTGFAVRASVLLAQSGVSYIVIYKQEYSVPHVLVPLPAGELTDLRNLAGQLGVSVSEDDVAVIYRVKGNVAPETVLQLGSEWYPLEKSGGQPFRWITGTSSDLCVFSPAPRNAYLTLNVTSFAAPRHLQVWIGSNMIYEVNVPADGILHKVQTPSIAWPTGPQQVRLVSPESSASPASLGQGKDNRQLSLGFGQVALGAAP